MDMDSLTEEQRRAIGLLRAERSDLQLMSLDDLRSERVLWSAGLIIAFWLGLSIDRHGWIGVLLSIAILAALLVYAVIDRWIEGRKMKRFMKDVAAADTAAGSHKQSPTAS